MEIKPARATKVQGTTSCYRVQEHNLTGLVNQKNAEHTVTKIILYAHKFSRSQGCKKENPLKRMFPEVLRKIVGVTEINING
jgi:hypothetical protein